MNKILVISGTDPTGNAGLNIDIKTINHLGVNTAIAISAITIQNNEKVAHITPIANLEEQILCAIEACNIKIIKIGMIYSSKNAIMLGTLLQKYQLTTIYDPVLKASSDYYLSEKTLSEAILTFMLPYITLLTPNLAELAALTAKTKAATSIKAIAQAEYLINNYNAKAILIKGGHNSNSNKATDILCTKHHTPQYFNASMLNKNKRGTGCVLSSAIAAYLAKNYDITEAIKLAKQYVRQYIIG